MVHSWSLRMNLSCRNVAAPRTWTYVSVCIVSRDMSAAQTESPHTSLDTCPEEVYINGQRIEWWGCSLPVINGQYRESPFVKLDWERSYCNNWFDFTIFHNFGRLYPQISFWWGSLWDLRRAFILEIMRVKITFFYSFNQIGTLQWKNWHNFKRFLINLSFSIK